MNLHRLNNEDLAEQIQRADPEMGAAWDELFPRIRNLIHHIATEAMQTGIAASAGCEYDDLFQVAQVKAFECTRQFDSRRGVKFTTYLYPYVQGALKNYVSAQMRQRRVTSQNSGAHHPFPPETSEDYEERADALLSPDPVDIVFMHDTLARLTRAMSSLSSDAVLVCELRFFEELSIDEIAQTLDMNSETVKSHIRRSRMLLQKMLKEEETGGND